ncbi:MAG: hypothetical protein ACPHSF_06745, partial [Flavobacteriales bacterium]
MCDIGVDESRLFPFVQLITLRSEVLGQSLPVTSNLAPRTHARSTFWFIWMRAVSPSMTKVVS